MPRCLRTAALGYVRAVLPRAALLVACAATATAGCGGSGDPAVAHVAGREIKKSTLEDTITHFRTEAKSEGHEFPEPGTDEYRTVQRQLLRLLVQRAELEAAAAREGVHATDAEAEQRLAASSGADPGEGPDAFAVATARAQLVQERLFARVTRGVSASTADARAYFRAHRAAYGTASFASVAASIRSQVLAQRRGAANQRWLAAMHRRLDPTISYARGYRP
jgi:hypothetical protein